MRRLSRSCSPDRPDINDLKIFLRCHDRRLPPILLVFVFFFGGAAAIWVDYDEQQCGFIFEFELELGFGQSSWLV